MFFFCIASDMNQCVSCVRGDIPTTTTFVRWYQLEQAQVDGRREGASRVMLLDRLRWMSLSTPGCGETTSWRVSGAWWGWRFSRWCPAKCRGRWGTWVGFIS